MVGAIAELTNEVYRILMAGGLVVLEGDGRKGRVVCHLPICGRTYPLRAGFAELALRTGASIIPMTSSLEEDGRIKVTFHSPIASSDETHSHSERVTGMVKQYAAFLETAWRQSPETVTLTRMDLHLDLPGPVDSNAGGSATQRSSIP